MMFLSGRAFFRWGGFFLLSLLFACGDSDPTPEPQDPTPTCEEGEFACGEECVDLQSDDANCGACEIVCADGEFCSEGSCQGCAEGETHCGEGHCADTQSDPEHCGGCGLACATGTECVEGSCTDSCREGWRRCGEACADIQNDDENCGGCGISCETAEHCVAGSCADRCAAGLSFCDGECVNTAADAGNCGACGTTCASDQRCEESACVDICDAGETLCGEECVDTQSEVEHCGACDTACEELANQDAACVEGACAYSCSTNMDSCEEADGVCGTSLVDNDQHCGACGNDCSQLANVSGATCVGTTCVFDAGACVESFQNCDGNPATGCESDIETDLRNCGACWNDCTFGARSHEVDEAACKAAACEVVSCNEGWGDCNSDIEDGCETDLQSDDKNCGSCGTVCTGCEAGDCKQIVQIVSGAARSCALWESGEVSCWGENMAKMLDAEADPAFASVPTLIPGLSGVKQITMNARAMCALNESGKVFCWGDTFDVSGGSFNSGNYALPTEASGLPEGYFAKKVSLSNNSGCVLLAGDEGDEVYCWGRGGNGTVSSGLYRPYRKVELNLEEGDRIIELFAGIARAISSLMGGSHNSEDCVLTEQGKVYCWKSTTVAISEMAEKDFGAPIAQLSMSPTHACALRQDGKVYCWGTNSSGQLGNGATASWVPAPTLATILTPEEEGEGEGGAGGEGSGGLEVAAVFTDDTSTCVRLVDGELRCFGSNARGKLGIGQDDGNYYGETEALAVSGKVIQPSFGAQHGCLLLEGGSLYCQGRADHGRLAADPANFSGDVTTPLLVEWPEGSLP